MKKVAFYHTTLNTPLTLKKAFEEKYPGVQLITVVDDGIVPEFSNNDNEITSGIVRKLVDFARESERCGALLCVDMCTTITKAVEIANNAVDIPFVTIDGPMLDKAVCSGKKVALLVTARTTVKASSASIRRAAVRNKRENVVTDTLVVDGAFEALNVEKNKEKHDRLIAEKVMELQKNYDAIALGQVSMVDAVNYLNEVKIPVLTSLESGLEQIKKYL